MFLSLSTKKAYSCGVECSFCGRWFDHVTRNEAGDAAICEDCADLALTMLRDQRTQYTSTE